MAITLQAAPTTSNSSVTTTPRAVNVTVATGVNTVMVVCCTFAGNGSSGGNVSSMSYNSIPLTLLAATKSATWGGTEIWYLKLPTVGTNSLSVSMAANSNFFAFGAYVLDGVDQTTVFRGYKVSNATTGTSVSDSLVGVGTSDYMIDSLCLDSTGHSAVASGTSQTSNWALETGAGQTTGCSSTTNPVGIETMSWTWTTAAPNSHVLTALIPARGGIANYGKYLVVGDGMSRSEVVN